MTLTLYLLGPGVGESVVALMPDGRVVVVDSCMDGGVNLPDQVLQRHGLTRIDLLVLTHPDLDHVRGLPDLVAKYQPERVWRYPYALLRDVLQQFGQLTTARGADRFVEAVAARVALDEHLDRTGVVEEVRYGVSWQPSTDYSLHALAPTHYDCKRAADRVTGLVERRRGKAILTAKGRALFEGTRALRDLPNMVSLGVAIEWGARRVLLCGDIENGDGSPHSGWPGVLALLDKPDDQRGHLVNGVDIVKVAHHGSEGAFFDDAWHRHALPGQTVAMLTTYSPAPLPHLSSLAKLRGRVARLGITTEAGDSFDRALTAGWTHAPPNSVLGDWPCVKVTLDAAGSMTFEHGIDASWFV